MFHCPLDVPSISHHSHHSMHGVLSSPHALHPHSHSLPGGVGADIKPPSLIHADEDAYASLPPTPTSPFDLGAPGHWHTHGHGGHPHGSHHSHQHQHNQHGTHQHGTHSQHHALAPLSPHSPLQECGRVPGMYGLGGVGGLGGLGADVAIAGVGQYGMNVSLLPPGGVVVTA